MYVIQQHLGELVYFTTSFNSMRELVAYLIFKIALDLNPFFKNYTA